VEYQKKEKFRNKDLHQGIRQHLKTYIPHENYRQAILNLHVLLVVSHTTMLNISEILHSTHTVYFCDFYRTQTTAYNSLP
jgi:hypothetical protein